MTLSRIQMKDYQIETDLEGNSKSVEIINDDEDCIIKFICFSLVTVDLTNPTVLYSLEIRFDEDEETPEMRQQFQKIGSDYSIHECESLINEVNLDAIWAFLKLADSIDPIPQQAYFDVMEILPQYDLSRIVNKNAIQHLVEEGEHVRAMKLALKFDKKGNPDALTYLANLYSEAGDYDRYLHVLQRIPSTSVSFVFANFTLHEYYQSITPKADQKPQDKIDLLEKKFRSAMNAGLNKEAANYFDELRGNNGICPAIDNIKGDVDTLILIARQQREMKVEIDNLKKMIIEKADPKPIPVRVGRFF